MKNCAACVCELHTLNYYYFESMLQLIVILWLVKWLFAYQHADCTPICQIAAD